MKYLSFLFVIALSFSENNGVFCLKLNSNLLSGANEKNKIKSPPSEDLLLQCSADSNGTDESQSGSEIDWNTPKQGLYENTQITQLDGESARNELLSIPHLNNLPDLAVAYHPDCPHCQTIVQSVKDLDSLIK